MKSAKNHEQKPHMEHKESSAKLKTDAKLNDVSVNEADKFDYKMINKIIPLASKKNIFSKFKKCCSVFPKCLLIPTAHRFTIWKQNELSHVHFIWNTIYIFWNMLSLPVIWKTPRNRETAISWNNVHSSRTAGIHMQRRYFRMCIVAI